MHTNKTVLSILEKYTTDIATVLYQSRRNENVLRNVSRPHANNLLRYKFNATSIEFCSSVAKINFFSSTGSKWIQVPSYCDVVVVSVYLWLK